MRPRRQIARAKTEEDFLRHAVAELDKLDPKPGEEAALDSRGGGCRGGPDPRGCGARAGGFVRRRRRGPDARCQRWLEGVADRAEGGGWTRRLAALGRAMIELAEAQAGVEACLEALEFNPRRTGGRRGAAVRDPGAGAQAWRRARRSGRAYRGADPRWQALDAGEAGLSRLAAAVAEAEAAYADAARRV
jgi:DNA repair protein RecN (Recombination protein N)